ncbi:hypothetical protein ACHAWF_011608, partial [Thalassiosira exigua]
QVSPVPPRRRGKAPASSPERPREVTPKAKAKAQRGGDGDRDRGAGNDGGGKGEDRGEDGLPATPPSKDKPSSAGATSSAAVATPGDDADEDGAKQAGAKDNKAKKKPKATTLHAFFRRADPTAETKGKKALCSAAAGGGIGNAKAQMKTSEAGAGIGETASDKTAEASAAAAATAKARSKAGPKQAAPEKKGASQKARGGEDGKRIKGEDAVDGGEEPPAMPSKKRTKPKPKAKAKTKVRAAASEGSDDLDSSPGHALAVAMSRRRRVKGKKKKEAKAVAIEEEVVVVVEDGNKDEKEETHEKKKDEKTNVEKLKDEKDEEEKDEKEKDETEKDETEKDVTEKKEAKKDEEEAVVVSGDAGAMSEVVVMDELNGRDPDAEESMTDEESERDAVNACGKGEAERSTVDADASDAARQEVEVENGGANSADGVANVACKEVQAPEPEEMACVSSDKDIAEDFDNDDDDITVELVEARPVGMDAVQSDARAEEGQGVSVGTDAAPEDTINSMNDQAQQEEGDDVRATDVAVGANEGRPGEADDEVTVVEPAEDLTGRSAKKVAKPAPGPRDEPTTASDELSRKERNEHAAAPEKSSKKKQMSSATAREDKRPRGTPSIAASLKRQAATCAKKKTAKAVAAPAMKGGSRSKAAANAGAVSTNECHVASSSSKFAVDKMYVQTPTESTTSTQANNIADPFNEGAKLSQKKGMSSASERKAEKTSCIASSLTRQVALSEAKKASKTVVDAPANDEEKDTPSDAVAPGGAATSSAKPLPSRAPSSKPATKKIKTSFTKPAAATDLSEKDVSLLSRYASLREKYVARAAELSGRPVSDDFEEEHLSLEDLPMVDKGSVEVGGDGDFPDALLTHLLFRVQGRSLPLSCITKQALAELSPLTTSDCPLTIESISSKIKLLAQRKSYLSGQLPASPSQKPIPVSKLDCFENADLCYMWRWELISIDLLPQKEAAKVKKARGLRKKLQGHHKAIFNLVAAIDKASASLRNGVSNSTAGAKLVTKVSDMEEKVLKFEREEEKARLLKEVKLQKQKEQAGKQRERELEFKRREEERQQKKLVAAKEREEVRRKKNEEKEREKQKKEEERRKKEVEAEEREIKRKGRMMSFFAIGSAKKKQKVLASAPQEAFHDSDAFFKLIDSQDEHISHNPFSKMSFKSRTSRRRKTGRVRVSVFVTVLSENAFAPQPYDEERTIIVPNRYKFLGFHENVRPPYCGTWSKMSSLVTGRRPFGKDTKYLDYDNDSEAEWEEGDDDEGEDLQDGDDGVDEEEDVQNEDDNDGWLAAEDDLGIEDEDEETRELRKKKLSEDHSAQCRTSHFKACVVAPHCGGLPHEDLARDEMNCYVEGFSNTHDVMDALNSHAGCIITPDASICLDAFPPSEPTKETDRVAPSDGGKASGATQNKGMSLESQRVMAVFAHNRQAKSKERLLTELLKAHPGIANSRAQAMRELDVIADKRRLTNGEGVVWEVKSDHLQKLGLKTKDLVSHSNIVLLST